MNTCKTFPFSLARRGAPFIVLGVMLAAGCEKPERKVLDIKAPGVDVEVKETPDGAKVDVDAGPNRD